MLVRLLLHAGAAAVIILLLSRERHLFTGFASIMTRLTWYWLVLAFLAELASIPPLAEAQRVVLRAGGTDADRIQMNLVTLASNAISMSVPAGVAVAEGYAYAKYRRFGANAAVAAWAELAAGAIAFASLAGVALVGALIAGGPAQPILLPILSVVFAGAFGAALLFRHPHLLVRAVEWVERHVGRRLGSVVGRASTRVREVSESLGKFHPSIPTWAAAFALSTINWLLDVLCLAASFLAVGASVPWGAVLLAFAGSKVVSTVGLTPAGLGFVEGGLVAVFVGYGTPGATATAAVLVYRGLTFVGLVGLGWLVAGVLALEARRGGRDQPRIAAAGESR
jgi:uncharacterized protein (TIRG00374 family)